jgi:glycosyltransferase involved in cell wall biosynthesis
MPRVRWFIGDEEFLVDMDDPAAIAQTIEHARILDYSKRQKRIDRAAEYSWEKISGMYRAFFKELLG